MMNDFLLYLKNAFSKQSQSPTHEEPMTQAHSADNSKHQAGKPAHSFVHFQRGDQIIYEPNEVH